MKYKVRVRCRRGQCLSSLTAPALSGKDGVPYLGLWHRGSHSGGGETTLSVSLVREHFFITKMCAKLRLPKKTGPDRYPGFRIMVPVWRYLASVNDRRQYTKSRPCKEYYPGLFSLMGIHQEKKGD
jgi:hypothetical protein